MHLLVFCAAEGGADEITASDGTWRYSFPQNLWCTIERACTNHMKNKDFSKTKVLRNLECKMLWGNWAVRAGK